MSQIDMFFAIFYFLCLVMHILYTPIKFEYVMFQPSSGNGETVLILKII